MNDEEDSPASTGPGVRGGHWLCGLGIFRVRVKADDSGAGQSWLQWGRNAQHTGAIDVEGQPLGRLVADITYDPLVPDEQAFTDHSPRRCPGSRTISRGLN